jgi:hypothetical protein
MGTASRVVPLFSGISVSIMKLRAKLLVFSFHVAHELPELREPPDLLEPRIAREQGMGTQSLLRRFPEPFHGVID